MPHLLALISIYFFILFVRQQCKTICWILILFKHQSNNLKMCLFIYLFLILLFSTIVIYNKSLNLFKNEISVYFFSPNIFILLVK